MAVGTRWTLQYSEVKLNHYAGVGTGVESKLSYNSIHHNGSFGIIGAGEYAIVEENEISGTTTMRASTRTGARAARSSSTPTA